MFRFLLVPAVAIRLSEVQAGQDLSVDAETSRVPCGQKACDPKGEAPCPCPSGCQKADLNCECKGCNKVDVETAQLRANAATKDCLQECEKGCKCAGECDCGCVDKCKQFSVVVSVSLSVCDECKRRCQTAGSKCDCRDECLKGCACTSGNLRGNAKNSACCESTPCKECKDPLCKDGCADCTNCASRSESEHSGDLAKSTPVAVKETLSKDPPSLQSVTPQTNSSDTASTK